MPVFFFQVFDPLSCSITVRRGKINNDPSISNICIVSFLTADGLFCDTGKLFLLLPLFSICVMLLHDSRSGIKNGGRLKQAAPRRRQVAAFYVPISAVAHAAQNYKSKQNNPNAAVITVKKITKATHGIVLPYKIFFSKSVSLFDSSICVCLCLGAFFCKIGKKQNRLKNN